MITCPVCDTENKDDVVHCECCGERLAAPKAGEAVAPEEMMAASLTPAPSAAPAPAAPKAGFSPIEEEFESLLGAAPAAQLDDAAAKAKLAALAAATPAPAAVAAPAAPVAAPAAPAKPQVLYSSLSGKAYKEGTPEHAEGFGPMGEELVATPPAGLDMRSTIPVGAQIMAPKVEEVHEIKTQPMHAIEAPAPPISASVAPTPVAEPVAPQAPAAAVQASAKVTVYHQRQPVHTHMITTDEVLFGRKDVRADINPDVDLTPWDEAGHVSRKHAYLYRQNRVYTLYAVSNGGVQLNKDLLEIGDKRELRDGDVIILAGAIAIKFEKL
jgi:hypothetical protein